MWVSYPEGLLWPFNQPLIACGESEMGHNIQYADLWAIWLSIMKEPYLVILCTDSWEIMKGMTLWIIQCPNSCLNTGKAVRGIQVPMTSILMYPMCFGCFFRGTTGWTCVRISTSVFPLREDGWWSALLNTVTLGPGYITVPNVFPLFCPTMAFHLWTMDPFPIELFTMSSLSWFPRNQYKELLGVPPS